MFRIIFIICICAIMGNSAYCAEHVSISKSSVLFDYSKIDINATVKKAQNYFEQAQSADDTQVRQEYLKKALLEYNIAVQTKPDDIYSIIKLGRIYDELKEDKLAKSYFSRAINIDYKNSDANHYFADFYYERKDYRKAIKYYRKSFEYGQKEDFKTLSKMGEIYEKFGDIKRAGICYKRAFLLNPSNEDIPDKIREIEEINTNQIEYYKEKNN